jgi:hypothetical protein
MSNPVTEKPVVLRPPVKPSLMPIPKEEREPEEAPQGAPAPRQPVKVKMICPECRIEEMPNGEGIATVIIPADVFKRLKMRSQGLTVSEYAWSSVIRPALYGHVY